jgi:hypothetical protein
MTPIIGSSATGDETEALEKLARMTLAEEEPALTNDDLIDLLGYSARADENGLYRGDTDWEPTWDLNAGAAEGWLRKAGRAAKDFNFAEDGQRFDRAQVYQQCMLQHELYANRGMGSIPT